MSQYYAKGSCSSLAYICTTEVVKTEESFKIKYGWRYEELRETTRKLCQHGFVFSLVEIVRQNNASSQQFTSVSVKLGGCRFASNQEW